jgi:hypothetical protein
MDPSNQSNPWSIRLRAFSNRPNRQIHLVAPPKTHARRPKNGARSPIWRFAFGRRRPESADVKLGSSMACDLGPLAPSTAKWRFRPSEKRQLAPFSVDSLTIFSWFLYGLAQPGANWRESDCKKRSSLSKHTRWRTPLWGDRFPNLLEAVQLGVCPGRSKEQLRSR